MNILTRTAQTVPADRMLTRYIQRRVGEALAAGTARRQAVNNERDAKAFVERVRQGVLAGLGPMPFGKDGGPLSVQTVARHDRDGYGIENVLLDSFPGAQVNANIYVPAGVGPFPAVVCACGHSGKAASHYQFTPQVFARNGYIAVAFDESLASSFRNRIYPAYKAHREPAPEELKRQFEAYYGEMRRKIDEDAKKGPTIH